jgi:hypothetical protein
LYHSFSTRIPHGAKDQFGLLLRVAWRALRVSQPDRDIEPQPSGAGQEQHSQRVPLLGVLRVLRAVPHHVARHAEEHGHIGALHLHSHLPAYGLRPVLCLGKFFYHQSINVSTVGAHAFLIECVE